MERSELREWWLSYEGAAGIPCLMVDGKIALLIIGVNDAAVERGNWKFGFQVIGEEEIRWREPEQLARSGDALIELQVTREMIEAGQHCLDRLLDHATAPAEGLMCIPEGWAEAVYRAMQQKAIQP